jgi:iron complex transport system ATP-binding protein
MTVQVNDLCFHYDNVEVLKHIDLEILDGEVAGLIGPNGAGKSTLLKCLNRILAPSHGIVSVDGDDIRKMSLNQMAQTFGYVPQTSQHAFPATVLDTVLLGRRPYIGWRVGPRHRDVVNKMLVMMDLDHLALRQFNQLSGGEQQKTLMARALVQEPRVLLLDEPTSNLDLKHQLEVLEHIVRIVKAKGISVVMAIHDLNLAAQFSDRIVCLKKGELHGSGTPGEVLVSEKIRMIYDVEVMVNRDSGRPHIVPLRVSAN